MAEVWFPYKTLEEKQGIIDANTDKTLLREAMINSRRFLVFDDGAEPPWDMEPVLTAAMLVIMDEINILRANDSLPARTTAQLKAAIKAKLGI